MNKQQSGKAGNDFAAACERLSEAVTGVAFHPQCPASVRDDLLAVCGSTPTQTILGSAKRTICAGCRVRSTVKICR